MHGIYKMVLFYKEEMKIAIRGETFQFEQNVKKWSRVEQNARNLQKGPFLQGRNERRDPWQKFPVLKSTRKLKSFGKKCARVEKKTYFYHLKTDIATRRWSGGDLIWTLRPLRKLAEFDERSFFTRKKWTSRSVAKVFSLKRNVQKLMRVEQNMRNLQKGHFLQGGNGHRSWKKYVKVEKFWKFWKKVCESWKKDLFLQPKNGYPK